MQPEDVRERRADHVHRSQVDRADEDAGEQRRREEQERERQPDPAVPLSHQVLRRSTFATDTTKFTTRGPHRDATESSMPTTRWLRTAAIPPQPGRLATVAADCPQQRVSASTISPGFEETMYSAESCGYPLADESAASAMLRRPNSL